VRECHAELGWGVLDSPDTPDGCWWPQDRAWFVATDIDLMSTYIGSSRDCARALRACPALEAVDTAAANSVTWDSDDINPLPPNPYNPYKR